MYEEQKESKLIGAREQKEIETHIKPDMTGRIV